LFGITQGSYIDTNAPREGCVKILQLQLGTWDQSQHLHDESRETCKPESNYGCSERSASTLFSYGSASSWKVL